MLIAVSELRRPCRNSVRYLVNAGWSFPLQSDRTHARATEETDWPAAAARRQTRGRDQGGDRRAANLRLPTCPRHPQAPSAVAAGLKPPNHKRVYRVMKVHGLLLDRHAGGFERRHDGRIAVDARNRRWCSDGFEICCDNGERVRVAFALDCCDREAMSFLATTSGVSGEDVRDFMIASGWSIACRSPSSGPTMAAVTSPARHAASLATSASNRERHQSKVHRAMEWPKPSSVGSSVTTSTSVRARMHRFKWQPSPKWQLSAHALIFVSLPFEFFQKRGPHKVGDANKFMPRCALNFEEHDVRYAGLDRSAVGSRKYFTALALSKGVGLRFSGHSPLFLIAAFERCDRRHRSAVRQASFFRTGTPLSIQKLTGSQETRTPIWGLPPGVRFAGLDRSAVGSRKYFTAPALSKGVGHPHYPIALN